MNVSEDDPELHRFDDEGGAMLPVTPRADLVKPQLPLRLAPPRMFGDINIRVSLRPIDPEQTKFPALAVTVDGDMLAVVAAKLQRGTIEIDIADGFGKQKSMLLTPTELIFLLQSCEKFVQELPA